MVVEDLQQIIEGTTHRATGRRTLWLLGGTAVLFLVTLLGLIIGVIYLGAGRGNTANTAAAYHGLEPKKGAKNMCLNAKCLKASSWYLDLMDLRADPCTDFHRYACGGWQDKQGLPADRRKYTIKDHTKEINERRWRNILESPIAKSTENSAERKLKDFFALCLHDYGRMKEGGSVLVDIIRRELHGWYVLDPDHWHDSWSLSEALRVSHTHYDSNVIFKYSIMPDNMDYTKNIISIYPGYFGISHSDFTREDRENVRNYYKKYIRTLGSLLLRDSYINITAEESARRLDVFVQDVFEQERLFTELRRGRWNTVKVKLEELNRNYTQIDYTGIFTTIFREAEVTSSTEVALRNVDFFNNIDAMLRNESTNRDRMLNNYIVWRAVRKYAVHLSWEYKYARHVYTKARWGYESQASTWETCMALVKSKFRVAMATLFHSTHIGEGTRENVEDLIAHIKKGYKETLDSSGWMDNMTTPIAKQKVDDMISMIGYPSSMLAQGQVDSVYTHLKINKSEGFLRSLLHTNAYKRYELNRRLQKAGDGMENIWRYAAMYNPFSSLLFYWYFNSLYIPPGALMFPMFDSQVPAAMNYGSMGSRIASAMTITVADPGRYVYNNTWADWWGAETAENYLDVKTCYTSYFNQQRAGPYLVEGENRTVTIHGDTYARRAIWRASGLQVSYQAFMTKNSEQGWNDLPGLNMTSDQMFFLSALQSRCSVQHDEYSYDQAVNGGIPNDIMYNGLLAHMPEFSKAFHCRKDAKLYVQKPCKKF